MKRRLLPALLAGASLFFFADAGAEEIYVGVGGGIQHTKEWAFQLAVPVRDAFEVHYGYWDDGSRIGAIGLGYRWQLLESFSFVFGGAYINRVNDNLLRHTNAYFELRWRPVDRFSCQVGHYSSIGDDTGDNVLLCGLHWQLAR